MGSFIIKPNDDTGVKEDCSRCFGRGYFDEIPIISDGENWIQYQQEQTRICPICKGKKLVKADFVMESLD